MCSCRVAGERDRGRIIRLEEIDIGGQGVEQGGGKCGCSRDAFSIVYSCPFSVSVVMKCSPKTGVLVSIAKSLARGCHIGCPRTYALE